MPRISTMKTDKKHTRKFIAPLAGSVAALLLCGNSPVHAGSAAWISTPGNNNWTSLNWFPNTIPTASTDVATFSTSSVTSISLSSTSIDISGIVFTAGASPYTITVVGSDDSASMSFEGAGVTNNSGNPQNFVVAAGTGSDIAFNQSSTAGSNTVYTVQGGNNDGSSAGTLHFWDSSSAAQATLIANGGTSGGSGGAIYFEDTSTGGTAVVKVYGNGFLDISGNTLGTVSIGSLEGSGLVYLGSNNLTVGSNNVSTVYSGVMQDGGEFGGAGGSLTKIGTGILTLTGANTYTGGTTIIGGLINFNSLANFGTGMVTLNGGGLQWAVGNTVDVSGILNPFGSGGATLDTNGNNVTLAGPLTGAGGLTKQGAGALTLLGTNTYQGNTIVSSGTLYVDGSNASPTTTVNAGALLGGVGVIHGSVVNGGFVSPGDAPGTLTVGGNYTQSPAGTLVIRIGGFSASQHDLLAVSGSASLAGTLQLQQLNGFHFTAPGQKVTFLTAGAGVSGTFATVANPFNTGTMIGAEVVYGANSVSLETIQNSFAALVQGAHLPWQTQNQFAVASALDAALYDPRLAQIIAHLDHEPLGTVLRDLDLISPDELTAIYQIAVSQARLQAANLQRRLEDVRSGSSGFSAAGFATNGGAPPQSGSYEVAGPPGLDGKEAKTVLTPAPDNRWGFFVTGNGEWSNVGDTNNARGYDLTNAGFTLGIDYKITDHFALGLGIGYDHSYADLTNRGRVTVDDGKVMLYGTYFTGKGFYIDAAAQGGLNGYETHRGALNGSANGSTNGGEFNALVGAGYDWKLGALTLGPTANFGYTYLGLDHFNEIGSLAPLDFPDQHQESITSVLGAKAIYDWKFGSILFRPELRLGWQHEYSDAIFGIDSRLGDGAGPGFRVHGPATGRDSLILGAGFALLFSERVSTYLYYDGELARANYEANAVSGGFRISF